MASNIDRYKKDLESLLSKGNDLHLALQAECFPEGFRKAMNKAEGKKARELIAGLPSFDSSYQSWYSEAKALIRQLLPDRLNDFTRHYEKPKTRKEITYENYRIEDGLQGLKVTRGWSDEKLVGKEGAIPHFRQQLAILESVRARFDSSLFDIRQLVQADLFDNELDAAKELAKRGFSRAAGALAGVVLERHLAQVCEDRAIAITKKNPGISDLNDKLKDSGVIDVPQWRAIQYLGDIRNLCDHSKRVEPTAEQVGDLIAGVQKATKTVF